MNYTEAVRAMIGLIDATLAPLVTTIIYPNMGTPIPTNGAVSWAWVTIRHAQGRQRSIPQENQHHSNVGLVTIQVFVPSGRGLAPNTIVPTLLSMFRKANLPGGFIFKDVTSSEEGVSGQWYQTNILATFDYDSIQP